MGLSVKIEKYLERAILWLWEKQELSFHREQIHLFTFDIFDKDFSNNWHILYYAKK